MHNYIYYVSKIFKEETSYEDTTSASNALFDDIVTNIDDCVTIMDNQCYEPVGSYPQYKEQKSSDTWQIIVVEEVSLTNLLYVYAKDKAIIILILRFYT